MIKFKNVDALYPTFGFTKTYSHESIYLSLVVFFLSSHLKVEFCQHVLSVHVQLGCLAQLGRQRVYEFGYEARAVVVGLAEVVGDHA